MDTENRLTAVRGDGVGGCVRRVKGLRKKKTQGHREQYSDWRGNGVGGCRRGQREDNWKKTWAGRRLDLGGKHTKQYTDDV